MIYVFGQFTLDDVRRRVSCGDRPLRLRSKCFAALLALVRRPGEDVSKAQFHDVLWPSKFVNESSLTQLVYELRSKLGDERGELIATVPGVGYRLNAEVRTE